MNSLAVGVIAKALQPWLVNIAGGVLRRTPRWLAVDVFWALNVVEQITVGRRAADHQMQVMENLWGDQWWKRLGDRT